jgi:NADH:ubiquinone oxidoreductase subunit 6 (subunit J)
MFFKRYFLSEKMLRGDIKVKSFKYFISVLCFYLFINILLWKEKKKEEKSDLIRNKKKNSKKLFATIFEKLAPFVKIFVFCF